MPPHFTAEEFADRLARTRQALADRGLDGLIAFAPETHYWLTGYDTFGFCFFQAMLIGTDGTLALLTRAPDLLQAQQTSIISDITVWVDRAGHNPATDLAALLRDRGLAGKRLGIEIETHGLTHANGKRVEAALDGLASLQDASDLVPALRVRKSAKEIEYVREAARLGDAAYEAALPLIKPGAFEGDILAAMHGAIFRGGGDYPGNPFILGSGVGALLCRYYSGRRHLDGADQLTLEWAGVFRQYHAALMRTVVIGAETPRHRELHAASRDALLACEERLRPGNTIGDVFDAHAKTYDRAGLRAHRMNACGYSLGARYAPSWMETPMIYAQNPTPVQPDMVLFLHMICFDSDSGTAMTLGRTSLVTETGAEPLSRLPLELDLT